MLVPLGVNNVIIYHCKAECLYISDLHDSNARWVAYVVKWACFHGNHQNVSAIYKFRHRIKGSKDTQLLNGSNWSLWNRLSYQFVCIQINSFAYFYEPIFVISSAFVRYFTLSRLPKDSGHFPNPLKWLVYCFLHIHGTAIKCLYLTASRHVYQESVWSVTS